MEAYGKEAAALLGSWLSFIAGLHAHAADNCGWQAGCRASGLPVLSQLMPTLENTLATEERGSIINHPYFIRANPRSSAARKLNPGIERETLSRDNSKGKIFSNQPPSPDQCLRRTGQ